MLPNVKTAILETPCTVERDMAKQMSETFTPICDEKGNYAQKQCFEHEGYDKQCWCVDHNGHERKGTRVYGDEEPTCYTFEGMD